MAELRFKLDDSEVSLDLEKLMFAEARAIEKVTGQTFKEVGESLQRGSVEAIQAMAWVALKRAQPGLRFTDLDDRALSEVEITMDEPEEVSGETVEPENPTDAEPFGPADVNL